MKKILCFIVLLIFIMFFIPIVILGGVGKGIEIEVLTDYFNTEPKANETISENLQDIEINVYLTSEKK